MQNNRRMWLCAVILSLLTMAGAHKAHAQAQAYIVNLRTSRPVLLANGRDKTLLIAEVRDATGKQAPNGFEVFFQSTVGTLSSSRAQTFGGIAQVELSSSVMGSAKITAATRGFVSNILEIAFTDNPEEMFQGNNYVQASGTGYLSYSATDRVIEAMGRNNGAKIGYRNISVTADRLQLRCDDMIVRAMNNVVLKRGRKTLKVSRLYYSLQLAQGFAIAEHNGRLQAVSVTGQDLAIEPLKNPIPNTYLQMLTLQVRLVIAAKGITYFPGDRLQFRQPRFFQDQTPILALPFYEMALNSQELFSDQFISVGTNGFGLELPFYWNLSPNWKTILYVRHQQQQGRSYFSQNAGWSLDVMQGYTSQGKSRSEGNYGFTGLTRGDWGFRWLHNQEFNQATQGSFYLDFPQHQGVYGNMNLNQQQKRVRWGANMFAGQVFGADSDRSMRSDVYVESQPRKLGNLRDMLYTFGTNVVQGRVSSNNPLGSNYSESTQSLAFRAFSRPIPMNKRLTLSHAFSVGQMWSNIGRSGISTTGSLSMDYLLPKAGAVSLTYDYVDIPGGTSFTGGHHRMGLNYNVSLGKNFSASVFGSSFLDTSDSSFLLDTVYRIDKDWRVFLAGTMQRYDGLAYNDLQFTLGRRLGAREIQLTYSTFLKRISIDLTATRF